MSVRENIKQFVPEFLHPVLRPVARRFADPDRPRVPHTSFPLDQATRDAIASSLKLSESSTAKLADSALFPEIEELIRYWGIVRGITQVLGPYNPSDKYFDWSHFEEHRARGLLDITKDLFVAWLSINKQPKVILEIGCRTGKSIATHLFVHPEPSLCTAVLIDLFVEMGSPEKILSNLRCLGISTHNVHPLVGYSETVFPQIISTFADLRFDYLLVDGSHRKEDALRDLRMVAPYVASGGYVLFDDIGLYGPGVGYGLIDVWNVWKQEHEREFVFHEYHVPWGFAVARRK